MAIDYAVIGKAVPRLDGVKKVTGRPIYTGDLELPGMLHGAILGSDGNIYQGMIANPAGGPRAWS